MSATPLISTERLTLRWLTLADAPFIFDLLTNPSWLQYIGDKGFKGVEDARNYIETGPIAMYQRCGHGLYLVERKTDGAPLGLCGLIKRDGLDDVDIGYGFMPQYWAQGYALESSLAVLDYGYQTLHLPRIVAITSDDNPASMRLLEKLGLRHTANVRLAAIDEDMLLYTPADGICI
ncbi:GNAT family N-acetyltransferase [Silvimonas iriomotensis]|uniref:GNAT family N-acetyltransferase n=1 Tax=Silvimonas iriomotensis TaxID=449662 RepID=UPI001E28D5C6|nr:GNAT family N-acetyltransferase [Silvimonas iriomotensis]